MSNSGKTEAQTLLLPEDEGTLVKNLKALSLSQPGLARRLTLPCDDSHLIRGDDGNLYYQLRKRRLPMNLPPGALCCLIPDLHDSLFDEIFLMGFGLGTMAHAILDRWPAATLTIWDRDPALMRLALSQRDHSQALREGRLKLALGADLATLLPLSKGVLTLVQPLAKVIYKLESDIVRTGGAGIPVALNLGGLLVEDVAQALREEGHCPWPVTLNGWDVEESRHALRTLAPSFVVAVNYVHGLPEFLDDEGIPLLVWEIDPTTERSPSISQPCPKTSIFTYRQANLVGYREGGFKGPRHLPLAANTTRRRPLTLTPEDKERYGCDVSFVGSSMVGPARLHRQRFVEAYLAWHPLGKDARAQCESMIEAALAAQLRAGKVYVLPEVIGEFFKEFLEDTRPLYAPEDPLLWIAEVAAAHRRLMVGCQLGSTGIHLWGDVGWRSLTSQGAHYRGFAGHGDTLTKIYCASQINIDMGRLYQPDIVTMRVFDVLACGGFLLAEASDELSQLFDIGEEVIAYSNLGELRDLIQYYRAHPQEARAIAERGRQAVLERHSIRDRIRTMLDTLSPVPEA